VRHLRTRETLHQVNLAIGRITYFPISLFPCVLLNRTLWPNGEQALANCQRLMDMARQFERGASSFRAFVEKLEEDAERGEADEAPIVEEGVEGVRVMTVHKAKGLEFPVVVLADPTCSAARDTPSRYVDPSRCLWSSRYVVPLRSSSWKPLTKSYAVIKR
jgi:ATP-dependent exoDNAse (exonuclease V) beta subunit